MEWLTSTFGRYPEIAVFLALGIGYAVGSVRVRGFSLGGVTGSLLAGMLLGWLFEVPVASTAKSLVFLLFMFGIGYEVGPRFLSAMKGEGWRFAALGACMPVVGLVTAIVTAKILGLDPGLAAGMLSGALTESPAMGTATEAIHALPLDAATKELYAAHVGVADALCYLMGALGVILTCTLIGPKLLRVDLAAHALVVEAKYGIKRQGQGIRAAWQPFETRAYLVAEGAPIAGLTVGAAERLIDGTRLFVHRIRRNGEILDAQDDMKILAGDHIAASGRREALVDIVGPRGDEVDDASLLDIPMASHEIFVSKPRWAGHTLGEIAAHDDFDAVFVRRLQRGGQEMPIGTQTTVERGDVVLLIGPERRVECAAEALGQIIRPTDVTDFTVVGFAIVVGALLGIVAAVTVAGIHIGLGTSIGVLLAGLVTGHVRGRRPLFGRVPDAAVKLMQSFGLSAFVAMVGLGAGPHFLASLRESGIGLFFGGAVVTFVPLLFGLWFGRKVLGIDPLLLLGAISGAQTFTAGLAAVQEKSGSPVAVIGYSGAVAVAHVLLTTWGTVMVLVMK